MKNNNKWTVRDVITTVLLTVALILIQLVINMVCMVNDFASMVLSVGITMLLCAPVYFLMVSRVHKRFVSLIYMTILERARELLKQLGLYGYKDVHPATLSGGQKQRLSLACGILSGRDVLIFDEPTSGLDGGNMRIIADMLRNEADKGKTILVITHDGELIH